MIDYCLCDLGSRETIAFVQFRSTAHVGDKIDMGDDEGTIYMIAEVVHPLTKRDQLSATKLFVYKTNK